MKTIDIFILLTLAAVPVGCVYQQSQKVDAKLQPPVGDPQTVRAVRYMEGMPNTTQVGTDKAEFLISYFVEIPLNAAVVVRQKDDKRWLCLAPTDERQDLKSLPCWILVSRTPEATQ
ncbi:MAG: hypothetical protein E6Q78_09995 [Rhodoferax sp.]|nr:MAG: hypothetical protein E6Q78_09995 [Rhodoferax sp.]